MTARLTGMSGASAPPASAEERQPTDDERAFHQTQKALQEALGEQKILRERLANLESRNRPAVWGKPVVIQSIDAVRGRFEHMDADIPPEQLANELKTAQHMLESAKRASDTARAEKRELEEEIEKLVVISKKETDALLRSNAAHHKQNLQNEQLQFQEQQRKWAAEKSELLAEAERL